MHCCRSLLKSLYCGLILLLAALAVQAADLSVRNPQLLASEEGYALSADFNINFNARLEDAVNKGVVLYFATDSGNSGDVDGRVLYGRHLEQ